MHLLIHLSPASLSLSVCHAQVYPQAVHTKLLSHPALPLQIATYYSTVDVMEYVLDLYPEVRERGEREEREGEERESSRTVCAMCAVGDKVDGARVRMRVGGVLTRGRPSTHMLTHHPDPYFRPLLSTLWGTPPSPSQGVSPQGAVREPREPAARGCGHLRADDGRRVRHRGRIPRVRR